MDVRLSELRELVMAREALRTAIHEVAKSQTRLSNTHTHTISSYIHSIFFYHSSVSGHLGYFHVLATVYSAAMNTGLHVSF